MTQRHGTNFIVQSNASTDFVYTESLVSVLATRRRGGESCFLPSSSWFDKMAHSFFEGQEHAAIYASYRPEYPSELYDTIVSHIKGKPPFCKAVDVGCGTGKSTRPLTKYFDEVVGVDISQAMLDQAKDVGDTSKIDYRIGACDSIPCQDNSVNLVAVASAAHWFDPIDDFYKECDRILKPGGCIALYQFCNSHFPAHPELDQILIEFFSFLMDNGHTCDKWKPSLNYYRDFELPYGNTIRVEHGLKVERKISITDLFGFIYTWSGVQNYLRACPDANKTMVDLKNRIYKCFDTSEPPEKIQLTWVKPVFLILTTKPTDTDSC